MSDAQCGRIRELLPDLVGNRLSSNEATDVQAHVETCEECREELELVSALYSSRAQAPAGLAERVVAAAAKPRVAPRRWWGLAAAAVAALALGIGINQNPGSTDPDLEVPGFAYEVDEGALWVSDDGLLAGAPSLDVLSDEALQMLLDELSVGSAGGSA